MFANKLILAVATGALLLGGCKQNEPGAVAAAHGNGLVKSASVISA